MRRAFSEPDEEPLVCVLVMDDSQGADGIVASKDIQSIADLKGKSVAVLRAASSQFYLNVLLKEAGLSEADIEVVDLTPEDAGEAFLLQEVDAAVTWEPWLMPGPERRAWPPPDRHLGATGAARRLPARQGRRLHEAQGRVPGGRPRLGCGGAATSRRIPTRPTRSWRATWAAGSKIRRSSPKPCKGVGFYDADENREYFGTPEKPGQIYQTMQNAIDVWSELGVLKMKLTPADVIAHGILRRVAKRGSSPRRIWIEGSREMEIRPTIVSIAAAICMTAGLMGAAQAEPLRISYFIWVGNGPFFVAQEKGLFAKEGVEVELINIEDHAAAFGGLFVGQVDAVQGAMPDAPTFAQPDEEPLVCVLALDEFARRRWRPRDQGHSDRRRSQGQVGRGPPGQHTATST